ncbi:hypothetical protein MKK55_04675 [Methylobacterium sp. J-059]|nr:hypothetical protein [Methylobacterium sp. J-059]MCJ2038253.1 hypothetical protein [Methylobacterium sp. J-059]
MALIEGGIPFDVAFSLDPTMRQAMCIIRGINRGGIFNFSSWRFEARE